MKKSLSFLTVCLLGSALPLCAQYGRSDRKGTAKAAAELRSVAREVRVTRRARESLEDHTRLLEYAIEHEQLTPAEVRKVRSSLDSVSRRLEKAEKSGTMSVNEAKAIQNELSKIYRTIWFLRRNKLSGKGQKIVFLGRQIVLREEYRRKFESGSLNQKEMREILHNYYSACRVREQLNTDGLTPERRASLERECFKILSEYFTLAPPQEKKPQGEAKK